MFGDNEKVLQAVVLADSFNERFMPITLDRPRCLLPLVNVPIIEYTFEFLAVSGVQEVILFCRAHADQIKQYISKSRWSKPTSTMHIQIVVNNECMSMGDALRDIDARSIIHGDFVLVCGDVVSNMNLSQALYAHKQRRKHDKDYILTMVLKETSPFHRSRERCENGIFAIDNSTGECIAYEQVETETINEVTLPLSRLSLIKELSVRYDLMDCQIDICSVNVLALYTENFDYQDVRKDFLRGVLTSDILGVKVATHILTLEYASRVRSPHLYDSISKDIIERWVFPIVPEADLLEEQPYDYRRGNSYFGPDVILSRSAKVGSNVVLGTGVSVGENSVVKNSVIGAHCQIGSDVVIENAYIWDHAIIENGSKVTHSILADHVRIRNNTVINRGCLVTSNITLGPRADIPPRRRIAKLGEHIDLGIRQLGINDGDNLDSLALKQQMHLGEGTDAIIWEGNIDEYGPNENEIEDPAMQDERRAAFDIGGEFHESRPTFIDPESDVEFGEEDDEEVGGELDTDEDSGNTFGRNSSKFFRDAFDLMKHAIETDYVIDNALLEINGLKFSCNATFSECRQVILRALFEFIDPNAMPKSTDKLFLKWAPLLARFTQGIEEQVDLIGAVKETCVSHSGLERSFQFAIPVLYKTDVLEEDAIMVWFQNNEATNSLFVRQIRGFVQWLQQDDESEEDESDEQTEDEEESNGES
jgi:translation initiation factor eIF-2B subunit epsilon